MPPINRILREFKTGDQVRIRIEPSIHKGMPHHRYQGKIGKVIGKRGCSYEISLKDGDKDKLIISRPVHIEKVTMK